jgi:hypothetical protein
VVVDDAILLSYVVAMQQLLVTILWSLLLLVSAL